jgi:hypothetical protein
MLIYFLWYKNKFNERKEKKIKEKKKILKEEKIITATLLCAINSVIMKNILFKYNNDANIFHIFNLNQVFLYLNFLLLLI